MAVQSLLAPKPPQEHICLIEDFMWHFCVNYILLNAVTRVIAYPIPRCDSAVYITFGSSIFFWIMDTLQGYHQLKVALESQMKLAFQGPGAIKWTWRVMPFGPANGVQTFIDFMHNMDSTWKLVAIECSVPIGDDCNTRLIVNDLVNFAPTFQMSLQYMRRLLNLRISPSSSASVVRVCRC